MKLAVEIIAGLIGAGILTGVVFVILAIRHFDPVERHKWGVCPRCGAKEYERFYDSHDGGIIGGVCDACDYYWHEEIE